MKNTKAIDEKLAAILKEDGVEQPTEGFTKRLAYAIALQHKKKEAKSFTGTGWLGKCILGILVTFNLIFLYQLNVFTSQPVLFFSIIAGVVGVWGIITISKKLQTTSPT